MEGANAPERIPKPLLNFHTAEDIKSLAVGCDADIGGTSTAHLDFVPDANNPLGKGKGRFWGEMRLGVRSELQGRLRGGYAGFRSNVHFLHVLLSILCSPSCLAHSFHKQRL